MPPHAWTIFVSLMTNSLEPHFDAILFTVTLINTLILPISTRRRRIPKHSPFFCPASSPRPHLEIGGSPGRSLQAPGPTGRDLAACGSTCSSFEFDQEARLNVIMQDADAAAQAKTNTVKRVKIYYTMYDKEGEDLLYV
jgi:hypothetical protein